MLSVQPFDSQRREQRLRGHVLAQRRVQNAAPEQIQYHGQKQPSLIGWDAGHIAGPHLVGCGHRKVAMQQIGRNRQAVPAVGGDTKSPFATGSNTMLHQLLHPQLAHSDVLRPLLPHRLVSLCGLPILRS